MSVLVLHGDRSSSSTACGHFFRNVIDHVFVHFVRLVNLIHVVVVSQQVLLHASVSFLIRFITILGCTFLHLLHLQVLHVSDVLSRVHLLRRHREGLLVKQRDDSLLAQHQFNHSFPLMLVEFVVLIEGRGSVSGATHSRVCRLRVDEVDADAEAWLSRVLFLLRLSLVLLSLGLNLVNSLFQKDFKLCLRCQLLVVLKTSSFEKSSLVLHHLSELVHDSVVSLQLLLFSFHLAHRHVYQWSALLVGCNSAECCGAPGDMSGSACSCRTEVDGPATILRRSLPVLLLVRLRAQFIALTVTEKLGLFDVVQVNLLLFSGFLKGFQILFERSDFLL